MTMGDILLGVLATTGFFVASAMSRIFRRGSTGIIIGGVAGIAVSVAVLVYGLGDVLGAPPEDEMTNDTVMTPTEDASTTAPSE